MNARNGAPENQFGVRMGDIRAIVKSIKIDHERGLELWASGNADAMLLATLIVKPKQLSEQDLEWMAGSVTYTQVADWLMTNVIKQHPDKEGHAAALDAWVPAPDAGSRRLEPDRERILQNPKGLDPGALLDRIEREMANAPAPAQWTMDHSSREIGIRFPENRQRAIDVGERLGLYRDYPVSKGCTLGLALRSGSGRWSPASLDCLA